ncbi:putative barnase/colicin E5 family endoribonuclease, partial [Campylobacter hyointestinalis]|uniref:putative barnase/colicin E5 family endoribonuclease n=1 Tax=Campylobacter hyointestinalis TaxID=198 RepID=UPI000D418340
MENLYQEFKKYANKASKAIEPLIPFSNANQYAFNPKSELYNNTQALEMKNTADNLNQQMANLKANQNGTFMLNSFIKSDKEKEQDSIDFDNKFIDLVTAKGYTPHKAIDKTGKARYAIEKDGVFKEIEPSFLNELKANSYEMLGSLAGVATAMPHPLTKTAGMAGKVLTPMIGSVLGSGAGAMADTVLNNGSIGEKTTANQLANSFTGGANNDILGAGLATALTSKPAINTLKGTLKAPVKLIQNAPVLNHILSQNIGGAKSALTSNLGGDHEVKNALNNATQALGDDLVNFVNKDLKTIDKTSNNKYLQKGINIANSAINKTNEMLKGLNLGKADAELLLSALGHENGVKNILNTVANNPKSAQKIAEMSSSLNKSFSDSINEQLAKFENITPKESFKNSFNQIKQDYADTKDFLVKNSNYQSDFKALNDNLSNILSDTQNINTRSVFNALKNDGNLENLLNAKNAINEQLSYINKADFKSSSDFINQKALNEAKDLIESEINSALKNDEKLINLYKSANSDYAKMKNISESNLLNSISRDGKTSIEALNAMLKSSDNINGVNLNDFLGSLGAKDRAVAEANLIKGLMDKNSFNGVVDFKALNQSLASLDFQSEFAKELKSQILSKQSILNNTSDILNSLGSKVIKSKGMSQGISADPLKRGETMRANFIVEKLKPLIPYLGNNEALKLHLNKAILNANGDFKLAIKNIDNIPSGNLPTPTRNLLNEFKNALKDIEQVVKSQEPTQIKAENQANLVNNSIKGDGFVMSDKGVEPKSDLSVKISVDEWVKELAGINPNKQIIADLELLYEKHKELFSKPSEVFKLIKAVKENPTFFYTNNQPNIALIGSILENGKLGKIGIQKDFNSENLQVRHATYSSNAKKENERLLKRNSYPVGSPTPTQLTFGKTAEPTANGAKALLGKKDGAMAETPKSQRKQQVPEVQMNTSKEHFSSANIETIPNPTIKEAENLAQYRKNIEAKYNITPIKEFGINYAEFYHDGKNAIRKLLAEKQGQVAGAFERKELGDIDLVWGEAKTANGDIKGYGLSKIEAKHLNDFASFYGDTPQEKLINGISEIISNGKIKIDKNGRATITYETKDNKIYKVGLKQNWKGEPTTNKWIITAYDDIREANKIINSNGFTKGETLPLNSNTSIIPQNTKTTIKPQDKVVKTEAIKKENGNKGQLAQQNVKQKEAKPNLEESNVLTKLMKTVEEIYTDDGDFKVKTLKVYGSEKNKDFSVYIDNKKVSIPEEQTTKFHDNGGRFAFVRDGEIVDNLSQEAKEALFDNNKISGMDKIQMGIALDKAKVSTLSDKIDVLKKAGYSDDNIYEYLLKKDSELIDGIASIKANTKFNSILDSVKGSSSQIQKLRAILDKNIINTDTLSNIKKP